VKRGRRWRPACHTASFLLLAYPAAAGAGCFAYLLIIDAPPPRYPVR